MDYIQRSFIDPVSNFLWTYVLLYVLLGAGLYFTWKTRGAQFRLFPRMLATLRGSRKTEEGISSFQAFAIGVSSRVGTGNMTGVAIALTLGGPGAIFWMWVVALVGMATAIIESTLAQVFKLPGPDNIYVGGPAYYIQRGLGSRRVGILFAILLIVTFGVAFSMVQANTIADVFSDHETITEGWIALILVALVGPVLFGGLRRVGRFAEVVVPVMAGAYLLLALIIAMANLTDLPGVVGDIVGSAFGIGEAAAGTAGGVTAALVNGAKRGLFSNEAGMGSAPNTAATATTAHPVNQGLIQSLGVFVDSILVCSATAFIILLSGVYDAGRTGSVAGATLTRAAVEDHLGSWSAWLMTVLIVVFAFSSLIGNYAYAEVNIDFLGGRERALTVFRGIVLASVAIGAMLALEPVWVTADLIMGLMAVVNLVAIVLLGRWAFGALRDYEDQLAAGREPVFESQGNVDLPAELESSVW